MGVNFDAIINRLREEEAKEAQRNLPRVSYWKPTPGKNRIRLMPPWTQEGHNGGSFYREIFTHWSVGGEEGKSYFVCPLKTPDVEGTECPVCDYVAQLRKSEDPLDVERAGEIAARVRYYSNIIDLDDPEYSTKEVAEWKKANADFGDRECPFVAGDSKVQVFSYGVKIWNQLLNVFGEQKIDLTSLSDGRDITIKRAGKGRNTTYTVNVDFEATEHVFEGNQERLIVDRDAIMPARPVEDMRTALNAAAGAPVMGLSTSRPSSSRDAATLLTEGLAEATGVSTTDQLAAEMMAKLSE